MYLHQVEAILSRGLAVARAVRLPARTAAGVTLDTRVFRVYVCCIIEHNSKRYDWNKAEDFPFHPGEYEVFL